jgi:vitamin B12 transporter
VWGPLYATAGARADWQSTNRAWTADPRAALAWRVDEHQTLRVAGGRYHQPPEARFLDPTYGNPRLSALTADHAIAGYEWKSDYGNVRLEVYRKRYRDLVTNEAATFYANGGRGESRGVDVFTQGTYRWLTGWVSYGYMEAKRKELDDPRVVPSVYGVKHSLTLVSTYQVRSAWQLGGRYGYSSGRPYTPVIGRTYDAGRALWRPVFGEHQSARMPDTHRLDARVTRLFSLPKGIGLPASSICVGYAEIMNVLATHNALEYYYNADYSQRYARASYFARRLIVAGFALTW